MITGMPRTRAARSRRERQTIERHPVTTLHGEITRELIAVLVKVSLRRATVVFCPPHVGQANEHGPMYRRIGNNWKVE